MLLCGVVTVAVTICIAILFCPINDYAVTLSRRFGSSGRRVMLLGTSGLSLSRLSRL